MSKLKKEIKRFLVAGFSAVGTDLTFYYILLNFFSHDISKGTSFLIGTLVAYIINKYWTFEKHEKSYIEMVKFGILYSLTLGANVLTNKLSLSIFPDMVFLAFLVATSVSTVLNFLGQKLWVFK